MTLDIQTVIGDLQQFLSINLIAKGVDFDHTTPLSDIGIDSFATIEILLFIERKFQIILPEADLTPENLATLESLAQCVLDTAPSK